MADTQAQRQWVTRVLGFAWADAQAQAAPPAKAGAPLMPIWLDAKEEVDAGIDKLQRALIAADDEDLQSIADFGLYGATKGETVRLMAALTDADRNRTPEALQNVAEAAEAFQDFLEGAPIVDLIENNPFGVTVPMRQTLGKALAELARQAAA